MLVEEVLSWKSKFGGKCCSQIEQGNPVNQYVTEVNLKLFLQSKVNILVTYSSHNGSLKNIACYML
jgi:hypothetical protein